MEVLSKMLSNGMTAKLLIKRKLRFMLSSKVQRNGKLRIKTIIATS
jgi:hypothetical protein